MWVCLVPFAASGISGAMVFVNLEVGNPRWAAAQAFLSGLNVGLGFLLLATRLGVTP